MAPLKLSLHRQLILDLAGDAFLDGGPQTPSAQYDSQH
jgi:hypothetical protein